MLDCTNPTSRPLARTCFLFVLTLTLSLTAHSSEAMPLPSPAPPNLPALPTADPNHELPWQSNYSFLALCMFVIVNVIYLVRCVIDWCCNCPTDLLRSATSPDNHVLPLHMAHLTRAEDASRDLLRSSTSPDNHDNHDLLRSSTSPGNHVLPPAMAHSTRAEASRSVSSTVEETVSSVNRRVTSVEHVV